MSTGIAWTDATWNPLRARPFVVEAGKADGWHCEHVSEGCRNCYAETLNVAQRWDRGTGLAYTRPNREKVEVYLDEATLTQPLRWRKPRKVFVCSMTDLFGEWVTDEMLDRVFAVMALRPDVVFQVLTKRPERMRAYVSDPQTPFRVARAIDARTVAANVESTPHCVEPVPGFPGYFVANSGVFYTAKSGTNCLQCGEPLGDHPRSKFCGSKCKALDYYHRKQGNKTREEKPSRLVPLAPDSGEQGHERVTLFRSGERHRVSVHRTVLAVFDRPPRGDEQGCHRDGNPRNNHIANLQWGSQAENWNDRRRHGNGHSHGERQTVVAPIHWPLPNCWKGTSVEDQAAADRRVAELLATPAAVRFLSCEPLLGPIAFARIPSDHAGADFISALHGCYWNDGSVPDQVAPSERIDWVIAGGESGSGARPCDLAWVRSIVAQCKAASVPAFVKQLGAKPYTSDLNAPAAPIEVMRSVVQPDGSVHYRLRHSHGGDMAEWPDDLRVRDFPGEATP